MRSKLILISSVLIISVFSLSLGFMRSPNAEAVCSDTQPPLYQQPLPDRRETIRCYQKWINAVLEAHGMPLIKEDGEDGPETKLWWDEAVSLQSAYFMTKEAIEN